MIETLFKFNCSTLFLLHPLGLNRHNLNQFGFVNCYLSDKNREISVQRPVLILLHPEDMELMQLFIEEEYSRTANLIEDYDYEGGWVVLVYSFPERWKKEYETFIEGKYSQFSKKFKEIYPKVIRTSEEGDPPKDIISVQYNIVNKTQDWKEMLERDLGIIISDEEQEYWKKPNGKEIMDVKKIKEEISL